MSSEEYFSKVRSKLMSLEQQALRFQFSENPAQKSNLSYIGGRPTLSSQSVWPTSKITNRPMCFVAQFDLATLPTLESLPNAGILYFFSTSVVLFEFGFEGAVIYETNSRTSGLERRVP